ncbi:protein sip5 [Anaeramoeba flamelloides]|uniref:Protein sip5 n=1 Tax=Anaeramoeba flamelloides TaxID=1746091 RepID=A0ABQ8X8W7_9EUKA|nr:protein sip5 [Anaeramoeba flamelloides]
MTNKTQENIEEYLEQSKLEFSEPTYEIYKKITYNTNKAKELIKNDKLAPMFPPEMESTETSKQECSICYNYFPILNKNTCCSKGICTECFLQICPNIVNNLNVKCPFCRKTNYTVTYTKEKKTSKETENDQNESVKFIEIIRHSNKKERETFENEFKEIVKKLLVIKRKELKSGAYRDLIKHDNRKKLKLQKERESFFQIRNNQQL